MSVRVLGIIAALFAVAVGLSDGRIPFAVVLVVGLALIVAIVFALRAQRR
ncbi:MAG: hypothetical protein ACR2NV_11745 [Thermoleophilaceae bacterium]|jgi:hypothetical protein